MDSSYWIYDVNLVPRVIIAAPFWIETLVFHQLVTAGILRVLYLNSSVVDHDMCTAIVSELSCGIILSLAMFYS